ncbi:MAG: polyribonucleotide nucleotidyltransferase [Myxococcota bacterium]
MAVSKVTTTINGKQLSIETGRMARQASSAILTLGDTVVLATACAADTPREGIDFFPLTCDYTEKVYAAGKIPGGFFKREGRPSEREVLTSRMIDRPIRPMFAEGFVNETQVIAYVLSTDNENQSDVLAMTAASAALHISDIPFDGPLTGLRVGRVNGQFIAFPTRSEIAQSDIDMIISASRESIVMVEGGFKGVSEDVVIAALEFGYQAAQSILDLQDQLRALAGKERRAVVAPEKDEALIALVRELALEGLQAAYKIEGKKARGTAIASLKAETLAKVLEARAGEDAKPLTKRFGVAFEDLSYYVMREMILSEGRRIDGRTTDQIRPITVEVGVLPRTHGSALFTRGETQVLAVTTLGTSDDAQTIDSLEGNQTKTFTLHYNFPPFSVGEVRPLRSPGRREVGHGALAERALRQVAPGNETFPYTVRIVAETLESNGSSSMASVCSGSLALFDAGVPMPAPVAGIAMGLIKEGERYAVLSDILGDEDHLGDMDFKVAGTAEGVTAFQMDTKIKGVSMDIMRQALEQARQGRLHILGKMNAVLDTPRKEMSSYAPRLTTLWINTEKIRDVIGPGGKVIRGIIEKTGVKIDIEDSGKVTIASSSGEAAARAERMVRELTQEAELGKLYLGQVKRVVDFGAFVEIFPGTEGLIHISQLARARVKAVTDVVKEGDEVLVKVIEIDKTGKIRLSRKEALEEGMD